jgi:hypothetical protein
MASAALPTPSKRSANFISRVCADPAALVELMARVRAPPRARPRARPS